MLKQLAFIDHLPCNEKDYFIYLSFHLSILDGVTEKDTEAQAS